MKNRKRLLKQLVRDFAIKAASRLYPYPKYRISYGSDQVFVDLQRNGEMFENVLVIELNYSKEGYW